MPVRDIARTRVVRTEPSTPIYEVAQLMADNDVGSIVVASVGTPVGMITDRDVALALGREGAAVESMTASDVMSEEVHTIEPDAGVFELTALMADRNVRRVPVVEETELVGIVTMDDLVRVLTAELDNIAAVVDAESPPY